MKEYLQQWVQQTPLSGNLLACALRSPDRTTAVQSRFEIFPPEQVEQAARFVAELFPTLQLNRLDFGRIRWIYENALLHAERRPDGCCLALLTARELAETDLKEIERLFTEFKNMK